MDSDKPARTGLVFFYLDRVSFNLKSGSNCQMKKYGYNGPITYSKTRK